MVIVGKGSGLDVSDGDGVMLAVAEGVAVPVLVAEGVGVMVGDGGSRVRVALGVGEASRAMSVGVRAKFGGEVGVAGGGSPAQALRIISTAETVIPKKIKRTNIIGMSIVQRPMTIKSAAGEGIRNHHTAPYSLPLNFGRRVGDGGKKPIRLICTHPHLTLVIIDTIIK
jgi:hypothetical protein